MRRPWTPRAVFIYASYVERTCTEEACQNKTHARGLCQRHYNAWHHATNGHKRAEAARIRAAKWYEANRERALAQGSARYAERREDKCASSRAYHAANREKIAAKAAAYRAEKREQIRAKQREYSQSPEGQANKALHHKARRALKAGFTQPPVSHLSALPCTRCGATGPSTIDHIVPVSWVATIPEARAACEDPACYQPLCTSCNSSKGNRGVWAFVPTGDIGD